jgi:lipopolysaccharide export system permease protein
VNLSSILSRYVSRSFLKSFGVTSLCLFAIIVLFDFVELQRRAGVKEINLLNKVGMILLRTPHFLEQVLPFIVFVAGLFVFWNMNRTNELVIFRSTGISLWRLILPISLTAFTLGCFDLTIFNPLSSAMLTRYDKLERKYLSNTKEEIRIEPTGVWLTEKINQNQVIYRASQIDLSNLEFKDLNIIITSPENKFLERIDAKTGQIQEDRFELRSGWDTFTENTSCPFAQKTIETSLNRKKIEKMKVYKNMLSFWKLPSYIDVLNASGLNSLKYQTYWHSLIASTFWLGAMVLLAAAFSCRPLRQGKTILMVFIGLIVGFFLYFFKDVTFALGSSGKLPPLIAAWLPSLLTLMVGAVLVFNQEDG